MAFYGVSKLQAVNLILEGIGITRVTALDSTGSWPSKTYGGSDQALAEFILDHISERVQSRGLGGNTIRSKKFTVGGGGGTITFPSNTLAIKPAGPTQFRNIQLRDDGAYDLEADTATFAAGDYFFDVTVALDFEKLDVPSKHLIIEEAKAYLQGDKRGDLNQDAMSQRHIIKTEMNLSRPKNSGNSAPLNAAPLVMPPPGTAVQ